MKSRFGRNSTVRRPRPLLLEPLHPRLALTGLPFGAAPDDTGEFLLGDVLVSVVLMESNEQQSVINDNSETWTAATIASVKQRVDEGLQWWKDALAQITDKHELNFQVDYTYADQPVATSYEPITRSSTDFQFWMYDFLDVVGFNQSGSFSSDIRAFNHSQRMAHGTDWAFTIFVVNDEHDADGQFAPGGFSRAFAFSGGRFFVTPAGRPASTIAHETGHMFWARDEYPGGGTYSSFRGYYNTQNLNAADNPTPGFEQVPSIMEAGNCESGGGLLCTAYQTHTSSPSSLEMVGWRDSDGDGVFDVLDVPHHLTGFGYYDATTGSYQFSGHSSVDTLPNLNPSGLGNDITLNLISRAEYRIDGGPWMTAQAYDQPTAELDLSISVPGDATTIEIRTVDNTTGVSSPIFVGTVDGRTSALNPGVQGFLWDDENANGQWDSGEEGLAGWSVEILDQSGQPLALQEIIEPDDYPQSGTLINDSLTGVSLSAIGAHAPSSSVTTVGSSRASTGGRVFGSVNSSCGGFCSEWSPQRQLRIDFAEPLSHLQVDAIGTGIGSYGRLEVFDIAGNLLERDNSRHLADSEVQTLTISRPQSDVAYAILKGHSESTVLFDNLRLGPQSQIETDQDGNFHFMGLPAGDFTVRVNDARAIAPTAPNPPTASVTLPAGGAVGGIDFGFSAGASPWRNPVNPLDVNGDLVVSPADALNIINDLNNRGPRALSVEVAPPYLDTTGDRSVSAQDVLLIINFLNENSGTGEGEFLADPALPLPALPGSLREGMKTPERATHAGDDETPDDVGLGRPAAADVGEASDESQIDPSLVDGKSDGKSVFEIDLLDSNLLDILATDRIVSTK